MSVEKRVVGVMYSSLLAVCLTLALIGGTVAEVVGKSTPFCEEGVLIANKEESKRSLRNSHVIWPIYFELVHLSFPDLSLEKK